VPPWINKFYILDLKPEKSYIKWCVDQGITVFVISWVNPDKELGKKTFDDYMKEGPLTAMDVIEKVTGEMKVIPPATASAAPCSPRRWPGSPRSGASA
jgi:polyhydroxyalkanoate synthase